MTTVPQIDYLLVERALLGGLPLDQLNSAEKDFCQKYKPAFEVGRLAARMGQGYYAHTAAIEVARDPRAKTLVSTIPLGQPVPVSYVTRKDGTQHVFDFHHYLDHTRTNPDVVDELPRIWLVGSLLAVGDALSKPKNRYFDHAPILELLYHLRNGVAHGNVFHFNAAGLKRLNKYKAHNKMVGVQSSTNAEFEIVAGLQGKPVLFEFMGPGDVLDPLQSVEVYLTRIRERLHATVPVVWTASGEEQAKGW
jgi:hypothetical protein